MLNGPCAQRYGSSAGFRWRRRSPRIQGSRKFMYKQRWTSEKLWSSSGEGCGAGVFKRRLYKHLACYVPSGQSNERTTEVRNLLTSWSPIKFWRKNLFRGLPRGVEALVAKWLLDWLQGIRRALDSRREQRLFSSLSRADWQGHSPSQLMREVTPFPCLKRPVHETITHLYPVSRLRILGYDPPFLQCCA